MRATEPPKPRCCGSYETKGSFCPWRPLPINMCVLYIYIVHDDLARLDELVVRLARRQRSPRYRRELLRGLPESVGIGGLRVLRSIERAVGHGMAPTVKDIAVDQGIEQSTASRAVNAVVTAGLVARSTCEDDQRKSRLDLTDAGRDVLAHATHNRREMLLAVTSSWQADDLERLIELLGLLSDGYEDYLTQAPPR